MVTKVPPSAVPGVLLIPIFIGGQRTANVTAVTSFKMPFATRVLGISAVARAKGANTPTLAVDVKQASTSLLASGIAVATGTVTEGTLADAPVIPDEAVVSVDLTIGGGSGSPTWDDITILLTVART